MANKELRVKIQDAYDTELNWKTNDPVLLSGQVAFSSDKYGKYKVGDGVKTWNQLEYVKPSWSDITGKPNTFNPPAHTHTISQISDIGNASVKHATTAGSANAVAWANISGKPTTFNPTTHNHTPSQVGLGNVNNTADANKNVNSAKYIQDSNNGRNIAISYQDPDVKTASYFPVFTSNNKIGTISASNLRNTIGAATKDHLHDSGIGHIVEKSTSGVRYVKIADLECTLQYHRLNQQFIFASRTESILLTVRCYSNNNTLFTQPVISYVALSPNPSMILNNLSAGLVNTTSGKNKIEIWYKQEQYTASLNIIPIGKNVEGYSLNLYSYGSTDTGSTTAPTFATSIPIQSAITWDEITGRPSSMPASDVPSWAKASTKPTYSKSEIGLGNVDNTADSNKSVKYATSAGSATTATKLGTTTKGSATQPIYLNAGVPTACTYTLGKSVPSNAVFTDTNTTYSAGKMLALSGTQFSISDVCATITNWNDATTNGWYMGNGASNAPTSGSWYFGYVVAHNVNYIIQEVYQFTASVNASTIPKYIRAKMNGTWGSWTNVTVSKAVPSNAVFTDTNTWIALKGATTTAAGTAGYAPAPTAGAANRYLRSDGTWAVPPDTNTTYGVVSTTANGLAPKRDGSTAHFLRGDGTWATPPNTTYSVASGSTNGLMSSTDKTKLDGIATGANKYVLPTAGLNVLGGVKTTSQVTSASGYTACPIIGGVPYYKDTNTTYTLGSFGVTATAAELNFCDGVTSNIQTQLNGKAPSGHSHSASQITGLPTIEAITDSEIDSLRYL